MTPRLAADGPARNPVARSLALAVLSLALAAAVVMGAVVFAVLLAIFLVGYLVTLVHAWWRLARLRRRAAFVDAREPAPAERGVVVDAQFEVIEAVEAAAEAAPRGTNGSA
jgi:hypothetical protein